MRIRIRLALGVALASLVASSVAFAAAEKTAATSETKSTNWLSQISLMNFRVNAFGAMQKISDNQSGTGQVSWIPTLPINQNWFVRGNLGLAVPKSVWEDKFIALNYQLLGGWNFWRDQSLEAGAGLETWINNGGTHPILSANYVYGITAPWFGVINHLFAGYSYYMLTSNATHEGRIGVGLTF